MTAFNLKNILSLTFSVLALSCGSDSSSNGPASDVVARLMQFDASNILHGFIPTEGQFEGKVLPLDAAGKAINYADGAASGPMELTTVIWMKDKTPYQTGLMKFTTPGNAPNFAFELTKLPEGVVCLPDAVSVDFNVSHDTEFEPTGARVIKGNCVYNVETLAETLPGDLVLLVNGVEVTIPAASAGETAFNIPLTSMKESEKTTWLPDSGKDRPAFVTANWEKIEKRSIIEDINQIKNVVYKDFSYEVKIKDENSPCIIENGAAIMSTQYHSEISVNPGSQLVTPALMEWHTTARKQMIINCAKLGVLTASVTSASFDNEDNKEKTITLKNVGKGSLTLGAMTNAGLGLAAPFSKKTSSTCLADAVIAPNASCTIKLTFAATAAGSFSDTLKIAYNNGEEAKTVEVALTGTARMMKISPESHDFGEVTINNPTTLQQFTITNLSAGVLSLGSFTTATELGLAGPYLYQNGDTNFCYGGKNLAVGASCTIKIGANSATAGTFPDTLVMPYEDTANVAGTVSATVTVKYVP